MNVNDSFSVLKLKSEKKWKIFFKSEKMNENECKWFILSVKIKKWKLIELKLITYIKWIKLPILNILELNELKCNIIECN